MRLRSGWSAATVGRALGPLVFVAVLASPIGGLDGPDVVLPTGTPGFPQGGWLCTGAEEMSNAEWRKMPAEEKQKLQRGWRVYYEADRVRRREAGRRHGGSARTH